MRRKTILLDSDSESRRDSSSSEEQDYSHVVQSYRRMKEELKKVEIFDEDAEDRYLRRQTRMKIDIAGKMVDEFKQFYKEGVQPKLDNFVAEGFSRAREGKWATKSLRVDSGKI